MKNDSKIIREGAWRAGGEFISLLQQAADSFAHTMMSGVAPGISSPIASGSALLTTPRVTPTGSVEIVEDTAPLPLSSGVNSTNSTQALPLELAIIPPGSLLERCLAYSCQQVESADCLIVGSFLPVLSACLARRVFFAWGQERIYPNLFCMLAAKSGDRKSSAIQLPESIAKRLLGQEHFLAHFCSAEALFNEFDSSYGGCPDKLLIADDANTILGAWTKSGYGERVGQLFLNLYDGKPLFEAFERNRGKNRQATGRRLIPEQSTSVVLGATFDICRLEGRGISSGLQRRFLFYAATCHGRLILGPPPEDPDGFAAVVSRLGRLTRLSAVCKFSEEAMEVWELYQKENRRLLQSIADEAQLARLNGAPRQVQKVAMLFEVSRWAEQDLTVWDGVIHSDSLQFAMAHVEHCLRSATALEGLGQKALNATAAEALLARVRHDFGSSQLKSSRWIRLTKTQLTAKYASQPHRPHAWKPQDLYARFIPQLVGRGLAKLADQKGKKVWYDFAVND